MQSMRWDDMKVLLALVRSGSLARAAERLGVNVSTVSRRLDALEEATGVHLFDRTTEGTLPTAAAEKMVPFAETMEHAMHGIEHDVQAHELEPAGEVRVTAPPGVVDHFLAPALPRLYEAYPKIRIAILSSIGYADLTRREADIALRMMRPKGGDLVATSVSKSGWRIVAAPPLAKEVGRLKDPNALRWVVWGEELMHLPDARWITEHVEPANVVLRTNGMTALIEAVRAGLGAMVVPTPYRDLPGLAEVKCSAGLRRSLAALPEGTLWLVGHRALRAVPRIAVVWEWLRDEFRAL